MPPHSAQHAILTVHVLILPQLCCRQLHLFQFEHRERLTWKELGVLGNAVVLVCLAMMTPETETQGVRISISSNLESECLYVIKEKDQFKPLIEIKSFHWPCI